MQHSYNRFNQGLAHLMSISQNVALIGKMGSGKSTVAQILKNIHGYSVFSFATEVRKIAELILARDIDKTKDRKLIQDIGHLFKKPLYQFTDPELVLLNSWREIPEFEEYYTSQLVRVHRHTSNFFYRMLEEDPDFDEATARMRAVIDDCRFAKEVELLRDRGHFVIIKLAVPETVRFQRLLTNYGDFNISLLCDPSENEIDNIDADVTIIQK